jgi:23S rRNA (cytosine1962-C5)-methyltransferase
VIRARKARPFFARHPWVFAPSIERIEGAPVAGDEVDVFSQEGVFIARGLFNPSSAIRVRLYRWEQQPLDRQFWKARLGAAVALRHEVLGLPGRQTAYRLVFSEGDGLSGLIVDRYGGWLVVQFSSLALASRREMLLEELRSLTGVEGIIARPDRTVADEEGMDRQDVRLVGTMPEGPVSIVENELQYEIDLGSGQKTGFYCDQRENRTAVAAFCHGKRVLDLFCYTGGFSLNALKHGGASTALGIDGSAAAINQARRNAERNGLEGATFESGDVLKILDRLRERGEHFDVVICDPPRYARHARDVEAALHGYRRLNLAALGVLAPGGILATCSCSGPIDDRAFLDMLSQVSEDARRPLQILAQRGQSPDHPVTASCLESKYLKCVIARVGA